MLMPMRQHVPLAPLRGFTIVELLIVIVVIAVLAVITVVAYNGIQERAENTKTNQAVTQYAKTLQAYKTINDTYPTTGGGFVCITGASDVCGNQGTNGAACFILAQYTGSASLDTQLQTVATSLPAAGNGGACNGGNYAGILYDYTGGRLIWFLKGSQTCSNLGGMNNRNTSVSGSVTRCFAYLP